MLFYLMSSVLASGQRYLVPSSYVILLMQPSHSGVRVIPKSFSESGPESHKPPQHYRSLLQNDPFWGAEIISSN